MRIPLELLVLVNPQDRTDESFDTTLQRVTLSRGTTETATRKGAGA
jgi:hypothetical protein